MPHGPIVEACPRVGSPGVRPSPGPTQGGHFALRFPPTRLLFRWKRGFLRDMRQATLWGLPVSHDIRGG